MKIQWEIGDRVTISDNNENGIEATTLSDLTGTIKDWTKETNTWTVELDSGRTVEVNEKFFEL